MSILKSIKFKNTSSSSIFDVNIKSSQYHFGEKKSILNFLQDMDQWTYNENKDKNNLILIIHNYLSKQYGIVEVVIYESEFDLMVLARSRVVELKPAEKWERWIKLSNKTNKFNFSLYEMSSNHFNDIKNIIQKDEIKYKKNKNLTDKYEKLGVFFL